MPKWKDSSVPSTTSYITFMKLPTRFESVHLPVMVWVHGGDFIVGSGNRDSNGPDFLVDEDVVLVTFNYRLGVLGFLSLQNMEVPGNNGLKDQILALKWIKKNIGQFGGDASNVTLVGESAGAASVHYHMLSPMSKGLFVRAISESGSALNPWAYQTPEDCITLARHMARTYGEKSSDPHKILEKLKTISAHDLVTYVNKKMMKPHVGAVTGPTIDAHANSSNVFLPDNPFNLIKQGIIYKVPFMTGVNNEEGLFLAEVLKAFSFILGDEVLVFKYALPLFVGHPVPDINDMALEVKNKYFNNSKPLILNYVNVITDLYFVNGVHCTGRKHTEVSDSPIYVYEFSFDGTANAIKQLFHATEYPGACHGDQRSYLFRFDALNVKINRGTPEFLASSRMVKLWTNFAKTGNPTPHPDPLLQNVTWKPVSKSHFPYLSIDRQLEMKEDLNHGHPVWWEQLYKKYLPNDTPCWRRPS